MKYLTEYSFAKPVRSAIDVTSCRSAFVRSSAHAKYPGCTTTPAFTSAAIKKHCSITSTLAFRIGSRRLAILVPLQGAWMEKCVE
jgi:hypothetical protein